MIRDVMSKWNIGSCPGSGMRIATERGFARQYDTDVAPNAYFVLYCYN